MWLKYIIKKECKDLGDEENNYRKAHDFYKESNLLKCLTGQNLYIIYHLDIIYQMKDDTHIVLSPKRSLSGGHI